jgi:hypothetical protein
VAKPHRPQWLLTTMANTVQQLRQQVLLARAQNRCQVQARAQRCRRGVQPFGAAVSVQLRQSAVTKCSSISVRWKQMPFLNHCQVRARFTPLSES